MNSTILNLAFLDEGLGLGFVLRMNIRDSETTELIIILLSEFAGFC